MEITEITIYREIISEWATFQSYLSLLEGNQEVHGGLRSQKKFKLLQWEFVATRFVTAQ